MTVWGVDERICVQRPPLLLGMCALEHARVKHVRYLCVSAGSSLLPCRPEKADGWDSLGLDLMFPKWEVAWGSDPKTLCLPYAFRPCPASVRSLSYFASFGVPAEPFALCQDWGSSLFLGVLGCKGQQCIGGPGLGEGCPTRVCAPGPAGPLGRAGGPYWSTGHPVSLLGFDASSGQAWSLLPSVPFHCPCCLCFHLPSSLKTMLSRHFSGSLGISMLPRGQFPGVP